MLVTSSVAVMTRAFPNVEKEDLILLQEISSYLLLGCGLVYVISVRLFNTICDYWIRSVVSII